MRTASWLMILTMFGCGGEPEPATVVEQCGNGVDDDGDGRVDCADADCAFECDTGATTGTATGTGTGTGTGNTFTGTTGVTNPSSPLVITPDPTISLWQHEVGLTQCPQTIGRILVDNTTDEQAQAVVWADRFEGVDVFLFNLEGETEIGEFVDWPIPAQTTGVVWVYYACNAAGSFSHPINVDFHSSSESNAAVFLSTGNIL